MDERLKRIIQTESNREADCIMEQVNQDSSLKDVHAPEEIHDALFAQIQEYEEARAKKELSEKDQELIRLGKQFQRIKKINKYIAAVLVVVLMAGFGGITAVGGPEKVIEVVERMMAGNEETKVNSDDERVESAGSVSEEEALEQIDEEFGFYPVRMTYLPEGMDFKESKVYKEIQHINMIYQGNDESTLVLFMWPHYRISSIGSDIEDEMLETYTKEMGNTLMDVKHYFVEENNEERWKIEFEHNDVFYTLLISNLDFVEINGILENIYFT